MHVPFVDLPTQYHTIKVEIDQAIAAVLEESAFIGGRFVDAFEAEFAQYIGVKQCIGVNSGTDAIYVALRALGIGAGDEVLTAANTFFATAEAIAHTGASVKFVDCHPATYNLDPAKVMQAITPKTKAIVPVHLYGQPANLEPLCDLAKRHNLLLIEDAAQAHSATYQGRKVGTFGVAACFSFYPGKNLGAYGDAGAVVTNDAALASQIRMIGNHGGIAKYEHLFPAVNSRLDGLQAAILSVKLRYLDGWINRRREVARQYDAGLRNVAAIPAVAPQVGHIYHLYVIRIQKRDRIRTYLGERGIQTGLHYPTALPFLPAYQACGYTAQDFPVAAAYQDQLLSLPMHADLTDEQVAYVIEGVRDAVSNAETQTTCGQS